ncbi:MAG: O-antigen ligase family protein [Armatimonadota bacterium]
MSMKKADKKALLNNENLIQSYIKKLSADILIIILPAMCIFFGGGFEGTSIFFLVMFSFIAVLSAGIFGGLKDKILKPVGYIPLVVFAILTFISLLFGESLSMGMRQFFLVICGIFLIITSASIAKQKPDAIKICMWIVSIVALFVCLFAVRDYALQTGGGINFWHAVMGTGEQLRLTGTFVHPGAFSGFLLISIPITLAIFITAQNTNRVYPFIACLSLIFQVISLLMTGTKFSVIVLVFVLLAFLIFGVLLKTFNKKNVKRLYFVGLVMIFAGVLFTAPILFRFQQTAEGGTQAHSTQFRIYCWKSAVNMIKDKPIWGTGPGTFQFAYSRYAIAGPTKHAHQSYLQTASESGIPALIFLIIGLKIIAICSLKTIWKERSNISSESIDKKLIYCGLLCGVYASALRGLVDSDWFIVGIWVAFCVFVGFMASYANSEKTISSLKTRYIYAVFISAGVVFYASLWIAYLIIPESFSRELSNNETAQRYSLASNIAPLDFYLAREDGKYKYLLDINKTLAEKRFAQSIALAPTNSETYGTIGNVYLLSNQKDKALEYFKKAIKYNPNSTLSLQSMANIYIEKNDTENLEKIYHRMLKIEKSKFEQIKGVPEIVDTRFVYAHLYFADKAIESNNTKEAIYHIDMAIDRLNRWRKETMAINIAMFTGMLSQNEFDNNYQMLSDSYKKLSEIYADMGDNTKSVEYEKLSQKVLEDYLLHKKEIDNLFRQ